MVRSATTSLKKISDVTSKFKEFLIIFFGAAWSSQSVHLARQLVKFLKHHNSKCADIARPNIQLLYLGNESSDEELQTFIEKELSDTETMHCNVHHFPFNDETALLLREELNIDAVPRLVVFDRNLDVVTFDAAADVAHMGSQNPEEVRSFWISILKAQIEERRGGGGKGE